MYNEGSFLYQAKTASGRLAPDQPVLAAEVVAHEPPVQVREHRLGRNVTVPPDRVLFGQPVHALDHPAGLGRVGQRRPLLDPLLPAGLLEIVVVPGFRAPAVLKALQGELAPAVGQDLADFEREERQTPPEEVGGGLLVLVLVDPEER